MKKPAVVMDIIWYYGTKHSYFNESGWTNKGVRKKLCKRKKSTTTVGAVTCQGDNLMICKQKKSKVKFFMTT